MFHFSECTAKPGLRDMHKIRPQATLSILVFYGQQVLRHVEIASDNLKKQTSSFYFYFFIRHAKKKTTFFYDMVNLPEIFFLSSDKSWTDKFYFYFFFPPT